jgi:hypothetical protein
MFTPRFSNVNFPAALAVLAFLGAAAGLFLAVAGAAVAGFARRPKLARTVLLAAAAAALAYGGLLLTFSLASRARVLARGEEKYFCEIDCHLAYSVAAVQEQNGDGRCLVMLRTRFDETTTSPSRPKDSALSPAPRWVRLVDDRGREYSPVETQGTPLLTPLTPASSYTTEFVFQLPAGAQRLRLLVRTRPAWPDSFVIGDENSWLHRKTYFAL